MKPASLIYSVEESPPLGATLLLAGISIEDRMSFGLKDDEYIFLCSKPGP